MKKKLFMLLLPMLFIACSSDEKETTEDLRYVQVRVSCKDIPAPNGNVFLFKTSGRKIDNYQPSFDLDSYLDYTPTIEYKFNGEHRSLFPISKYGSKNNGDLFLSDKYSVHTIYWDSLSKHDGTPRKGEEYVICISLRNGVNIKAYKKMRIERNSIIHVQFPESKDLSGFVEAKWSIEYD